MREKHEAALRAKLTELREDNRLAFEHFNAVWNAGRWTRIRAALLAYLKKDVLSIARAQVARERQTAAAAAAAVAAAAAAEAAAAAGCRGGIKRAAPLGAISALKAQSHAGTDKARVALQPHPSMPGGTEARVAEGDVVTVHIELQDGHPNGHSRGKAPLAPLGPAHAARTAAGKAGGPGRPFSKLGWGGKKSLG